MINHRVLVLAFCMTLLIAPGSSFAQQAKGVHRIAIIAGGVPVASIAEGKIPRWSALLKGLRQLGYVEGDNLIVDRWSTKDRKDLNTDIATPVVASRPDLIFAQGSPPLLKALLAATKTIPIVTIVYDPVILGFAVSLARPGGNLTGLSFEAGTDGKRLGLLHEVVPSARRVGYLHRRDQWGNAFRRCGP